MISSNPSRPPFADRQRRSELIGIVLAVAAVSLSASVIAL